MQRKRRCAFDSDSLEEYIQLATIGQNQTNLFYDDKKLRWIKDINKKEDNVKREFEGFEHLEYIDTAELPPEIQFVSNSSTTEEVYTHHIMVLGDVERTKQDLALFCMESRRNSGEDFDQELVSPMKKYVHQQGSKLCLDLAIKRIHEQNGVHVVKFLIHDVSIQNFEPIIHVYFLQTTHFVLVLNRDKESSHEMDQLTQYIRQKASKINQIFRVHYSDNQEPLKEVPPNEYGCSRWTFAKTMHQVRCIFQTQDHRSGNQLKMNQLYSPIYDYMSIISPKLEALHLQPQQLITTATIVIGQHDTVQHSKYIQLTESMLLKLDFDSKFPPITDLSFYYLEVRDDQVVLEEGIQVCPILIKDKEWHYQDTKTFTYDLAEAFGTKTAHQSGKTLLLCFKRDPLEIGWRDLMLIPSTLDPPDGYVKLEQAIQNKVLAFQYADSPFIRTYQPQVSDRYPRTEKSGAQFRCEISQFCFPFGIKLYKMFQQPKQHSFIMTSETGVRTYGAVLIFCQEMQREQKELLQIDGGAYYEIAICLTSRINLTDQSLDLLKMIYQYHLSKNDYPIERLVCNIVDEIYLPETSDQLCSYESIKFKRSIYYPECPDSAFQCLFSLLSRKNIATLFFALMLEKKIQIISKSLSLPCLVIQALLALAYPFEYTHILITSVSPDLETYIQAPVPYMIGLQPMQSRLYKKAIQVYLDHDNVVENTQINVPEEIHTKLVDKLKLFSFYYNPSRFLESPDQAFRAPIVEDSQPINQFDIREVFLRFMIAFMQNYRKYLDKEKEEIRTKEFIHANSKFRNFLNMFTETRFFTYFIQQRVELSENDLYLEYFDDCLATPKRQHFEQPIQLQLRDYLPPNRSGLDHKFYSYDRFPETLDSKLLIPHRIVVDKSFEKPAINYSPIDLMRYELQVIYKSWFLDLRHSNDPNIIRYSLQVIQEMKDQRLQIDTDIFRSVLVACGQNSLDDLALEFVQLVRKLGYHKLLFSFQVFFESKSKQLKSAPAQLILEEHYPLQFYLEAKCYKCGRIYSLEDIFATFSVYLGDDQFRCISGGTLGCNNVFVPLLMINKKEFYFCRPSNIVDRYNKIFFYQLIGLPYLHLFQGAPIELQNKQLEKKVVKKDRNVELVHNIANMYTDHDFDAEGEFKNKAYLSVHEVFGNYLKEFRKLNIKPVKHKRAASCYSD